MERPRFQMWNPPGNPCDSPGQGWWQTPHPPKEVSDLFLGVPDFVGDLAADRSFFLLLGVLGGPLGVFGLAGESVGGVSFEVREFGARRSRQRVAVGAESADGVGGPHYCGSNAAPTERMAKRFSWAPSGHGTPHQLATCIQALP